MSCRSPPSSFFSHTRPVRQSVTVPSPLSVKSTPPLAHDGLHVPPSPTPISPSWLVSAAAIHVVKSEQACPLQLAGDLIAQPTFPVTAVVTHGTPGLLGARPH